MIFAKLKDRKLYENMYKGFKEGFDFIQKVIDEDISVGRYEIDGDNVYASVQEYTSRDYYENFEGHRNYIDIQYIVSGREYMECSHISDCETVIPYSSEGDAEFFVSKGLKVKMECSKESFAIFFPDDIHKPGVKLDTNSPVKKVVVKVHI